MSAQKRCDRKAKLEARKSIETDSILSEIKDLINDLILTSDDFDAQLVTRLLSMLRL